MVFTLSTTLIIIATWIIFIRLVCKMSYIMHRYMQHYTYYFFGLALVCFVLFLHFSFSIINRFMLYLFGTKMITLSRDNCTFNLIIYDHIMHSKIVIKWLIPFPLFRLVPIRFSKNLNNELCPSSCFDLWPFAIKKNS